MCRLSVGHEDESACTSKQEILALFLCVLARILFVIMHFDSLIKWQIRLIAQRSLQSKNLVCWLEKPRCHFVVPEINSSLGSRIISPPSEDDEETPITSTVCFSMPLLMT